MKDKIIIDKSKVIITEPIRIKEGGGGSEILVLFVVLVIFTILKILY